MASPVAAELRTMRHAPVLTGIQIARDANDAFRQGLWTIVLCSGQVRAYQLPSLSNPARWPGGPAAFEQTQSTWTNTTGALQTWTRTTLRHLIAIPQQLLSTSTHNIVPILQASINLIQSLVLKSDQGTQDRLMTELQMLNILFRQNSSQMSALIQSVQPQFTVFDAGAATMKTLAFQALQAAGNEKQLIQNLNLQIATLHSDITSAAVAIAGGSLAAVAGIGMGILGIVLAPAAAGVTLALLVPAALITAGGVYMIALDSLKIEQDTSAISSLNTQISQLSGDIVLVNIMASTLTSFSSQVGALRNALNAILAPWEAARSYVANMINEINATQTVSRKAWQRVNGELSDILNGWNSLIAVMSQLEADAQVAPGSNLQLGMSEAQVHEAMNASPKVPLVQYVTAAA
jgi:hypothetical protein